MENIFANMIYGNTGDMELRLHPRTNSGLVNDPSKQDEFVYDDIDNLKLVCSYLLTAITSWGELKVTPAPGVYSPNLHVYLNNNLLIISGLFLNTNSTANKKEVVKFELPYAPKPAKSQSWQFNYFDEAGNKLTETFTVYPDRVEDNTGGDSAERYGYINLAIPMISKPVATSHIGVFDSPVNPPDKA